MTFLQRNNPIYQRQLIRLGVVALIAIVAWFARSSSGPQPANRQTDAQRGRTAFPAPERNAEQSAEVEPEPSTSSSLTIHGLVLRDEEGHVVYRGDIDLRPTLERIANDRKLRFSHDGTVFENRERRLPWRPSGYYDEWVVPTPNERGPGPQRLVVGEDGDVWYTPDHYRTFQRIDYQLP